MADNMLGTGGARNAAKAIRNRKNQVDAATDSPSASTGLLSKEAPKMRDASKGALKDHQMQEAIRMMKKKKSANRSDYE